MPDKGQGKTFTIEEALEVEPKLKQLVDERPARQAELVHHSKKLEGLDAATPACTRRAS